MSDPPPPALLQVENLSTSFPTARGPRRAVDGVSFTLARGETLGVVGESGSGKTVLARTIMNLLPRPATIDPESSVSFDGTPLSLHGPVGAKQPRHFWGVQMAMVVQDPMTALNPTRLIGKQLTDPLRYHLHLDRRAAAARAVELLELVGLAEPARRMRQYPHELSGGMRQRALIAMALSCHPALLIADEPTTALDVTVQKEILDLLARLQADLQMALVLISHDLGVVAGRTDRTVVMCGGRFVETAPTAALFAHARHPYTDALLRSVPRLDAPSHTHLVAIGGRPTDLLDRPPGCRFANRCPRAQAICTSDDPVLAAPGADARHLAACHFPLSAASPPEAGQEAKS